jgi:hypothetical protein
MVGHRQGRYRISALVGSVSTTKICGTDNDFNHPFGTGTSLHRIQPLRASGYYQPVPPGQKPFSHRNALAICFRVPEPILADLVAISGLMWVAEFPRVNPGTPPGRHRLEAYATFGFRTIGRSLRAISVAIPVHPK